MSVAGGPGGPAPAVDGGPEYGPPAPTVVRGVALSAGLLVLWAGALAAERLGALDATGALGTTHLLFAGVACTAIAAAVPQFVAVWSTTPLRWPHLAAAAPPLVAVGTLGVAGGFLTGSLLLTALGGIPLAGGLWSLTASVTRTVLPCRPWDATERGLIAGTWSLALGGALGLVVGATHATTLGPVLGVDYPALVGAHATLMVLGGVLGVGYAGVFRLSSMLTGAPDDPRVQRVAAAVATVHPASVGLLAGGRLVGVRTVALAGAVGVVTCAFAAGAVVARRVWVGRESSPATRRYGVVAVALPAWGATAGARWAADPLARTAVLGGRAAEPLLWGAVVCLVVGSLYHVGPFLVWLERYADRLGLEPVPTVDDLYDDRVARVDGAALVVGVAALTAAAADAPWATTLGAVGAAVLVVAAAGVCANLVRVVHLHAPWTVAEVMVGGTPE
ncbi:hypothetical protein [Halobaculum marinum]|uniref:Uncharacterized protein n=1 Tax=Halobaculum marinum TaxID=3031996 RepID=A0ABD5WZQ5_9EURY|nr:hypothetical protein [Halobaculum sp. DT55]